MTSMKSRMMRGRPNLIISLTIFLLFSTTVSTYSTDYACPDVCTCEINRIDSSIVKATCETGGLNDKELARILSELPETVLSIFIIGPDDNPNKFIISQDFSKFYDLEELHLVNCGLRSLGTRTFAANTYLRRLNVSFNSISELSPDTFDGMDQLEILDLSTNQLSKDYMVTGMFAYLTNLRSFNLSNNLIKNFPSNLFGELRHLNELILDQNFPSSKDLHILYQLPQLEHLSLSRCNITYLPTSAFSRNKRMKRLNLGRNDLRTMEIPALKNVLQLEELDLSYNGITRIPENLLSMFPDIRCLNLAGNQLGTHAPETGISAKAFALANFTSLDLSENGFDTFEAEKLGDTRSSIRTLSLSGNKLTPTQLINVTRDMISLTELHISGLGLTHLPYPLPREFDQLKLLNISSNPLDYSVFNTLKDMENLEILDVSYCNITKAPPEQFIEFLSKLRLFYIHDNKWHCDCQLAPLRDLLKNMKTPTVCHELCFARIQCFTPPRVRGTPLTLVQLYGGCDGDLNDTSADSQSSPPSSGHLTINSEISILIAGVCIAVFIVIAFIIGIACSHMRPQASYRTHEDKVNLSANSVTAIGGLNNNEQDEMNPSTGQAAGVERLF